MYDVLLLPQAEKAYARAAAPLARKLARGFQLLENDPFRHRNIIPLAGPLKGLFRLRVGEYRIVYHVDAEKKVVHVVRIAHRKEAYE